TTLIYRGKEILSRFDHDLRRGLHVAMEEKGIRILCEDIIQSVALDADGKRVAHTMKHGDIVADQVMLALGRVPNTRGLGLEAAGVKTDERGAIIVDAFSRTSAPGIY
ncbi:FAD-dependent oxidoreductase, partial [Ensifer sp. ENS04]